MLKEKGKFIVIYGINNIGKSTQVKMLVEALRQRGTEAESIKYPIYDLAPTGPRVNRILREESETGIYEIELQKIYAQNRMDFEPQLTQWLDKGTWVVAEDYTGTGIAWGWTKGASLEELEKINEGLLKEDIAILLDGEPFRQAKEANHIHEQQEHWMQECRQKHLELAKRYGWSVVNANLLKDEVHEKIWEIVKEIGLSS